ncbi:hypothetical protein LTR94_015999 [Friedmanniomyces endolithicus]|nr:hypothetical protein LTR94_015999 [Friedmanniomyces endolithicus]
MTMQSKTQNPPWRHHFIPQFLLEEWKTGGELLRYYRDWRGDVQCEPKSPKGVCFGRDLYKTEGFPPEHAQQMETIFMQWIDNAAANVHARLLRGEVDALSDQECTEWARFVMSLIFRTPLDIRGLREAVAIQAERARPLMEADGEGEELPPVAVQDLQMKILRTGLPSAMLRTSWERRRQRLQNSSKRISEVCHASRSRRAWQKNIGQQARPAKNQPEMGNPPIFAGQSVEFAASLAAHYLCLPLPEADSRHRVCDRQYVLIQEGGYALVARPKGGCRACRRD